MQVVIQLINFLDVHSGSLTFLVTAVYVIATIFICYANLKSAKATREQVTESKRQFEEARRLEIMPYLQFESYDGLSDKTLDLILVSGDLEGGKYIEKLSIKNVGLGTANNIAWVWNWFNGSLDKGDFPVKALRSGEIENLKIAFVLPKGKYGQTKASMVLKFEDLLGNCYSQTIEFNFTHTENGLRLKNYTNNPPAKKN